MGSDLFTALREQGSNIRRGGGEIAVGPPEDFIIIGRDFTAEKLSALYPDESAAHERARRIIAGIRDRTRTANDPPASFIASLRNGQEEPGKVANLGPDKRGKVRIVVVVGRQRNMGLRVWNRDNPARRWDFSGLVAPLKHNSKAGIDAELDAILSNAASNVFVAMPESGRADHAAMLAAKEMAHADIATAIGARDADHVRMLLDLAECCEAVHESVDSGRVPLSACADLKKHSHEEQARRVARRQAGPSRAAKNGAAQARAKSLPAHVIAKVESEIRGEPITIPSGIGVHGMLRACFALARGDYAPALAIPDLRAALLRAGYDEEKGRLPTGPNRRGKDKGAET